MNHDRIINITIRIADLPRIPLRIPREQEETARQAEERINELSRNSSVKEAFSAKPPTEILAMVTYRFAHLYFSNLQASRNLDSTLDSLESSLDDLLLEDVRP